MLWGIQGIFSLTRCALEPLGGMESEWCWGAMCADDCHTYISHSEAKEAVSRNRFCIPWIIGSVGVIWAIWVPARPLRLPQYWASVVLCIRGGCWVPVACALLILHSLSNPNKKRSDPCLPLHFKDSSKAWEGQWWWGKGKSLAKWKVLRWFKELVLTEQGWLDLLWGPLGSLLLVVIFGAGKPACPKISLPAILPGSVIPTTRTILQLKALHL